MAFHRRKYNGSGWDAARKRGRYKEDFNGQYAKFRKEVRKRDKICKMPDCGCKKTLQVHHILRWADAPLLRYEPRNGILLCKYCHNRIKGQEEFYIELFTKIVENTYDNLNRQ